MYIPVGTFHETSLQTVFPNNPFFDIHTAWASALLILGRWQCESLTSGMSDEFRFPRFFMSLSCNLSSIFREGGPRSDIKNILMNRSFKGIIFFVLMTLVLGTGAQTVTLTFTGRGSDNHYVRLNKVVINNLTKNWQETTWWPDTTLTMQNGTGIKDYDEDGGFALSQNNPNPFSGTTEVSLTVAEEGKVQLEIADMNGHAVVEPLYFTSLQPSNHQFRVSLSTAGTYVMTARQNGKTSSIKMICNGGCGSNAIDYLGETQSITYMLKSTTNKPFNYGDMMEYIGYATFNGSEMESQRITQAQGTSQTFILQFSIAQTPNAPTNVSATLSGSQIQITWNSVSNATSYKVYRSSTANGTYSQIGSATSNTYLFDSNPLTGINYYKVKAVNSAGESDYSSVASCYNSSGDGQPCPNAATVTDIDGNTYNTVQIGQQCWMKENLRTKRYTDGTLIQSGNTNLSTTVAYYYYPNHDSSYVNVSTHGLLYNWKAVMHNSSPSNAIPSGVQGICPNGWHVPSKAEWELLMDYAENQNQFVCVSPHGNDIAKALASTIGWNSSTKTCAVGNNPNNNNATGLDVLPSGYFHGNYMLWGKEGTLWSSTFIESEESIGDSGFVEVKDLYYDASYIVPVRTYRYLGYPIRCVFGAGSTVSVPNVPTGVSAYLVDSRIYLTWNPVPSAGTYRVYRSSTPNGTYSQIGFLTTNTWFYDHNPMNGYNYYKVTAVNSAGESSYSSYVYCNYSGSTTVPSAPTGVSATVSGSQVYVSWGSVSNATSYKVYRSSTASGTYTQIGSTTSNTYLYDSSPLTGYNYYKVTAVNNAGESSYSSYVYCNYSGSTTVPSAPTGVSATVSGSQVYVSWGSVSNATSYKVYRSSTASGTYTQIGSTTSNTYLYDSSPLTGYNYYKVKAVNSAGESSYSSYAYCNYSGGATVPSAPTGVSATVSGSQVYVSWGSVSNATSYKVYRSSTASGTYTQIGSTTSNTYLYDSSPLTGYNYYKVKAVNSAGESSYSSYAYCNYSGGATVPSAPTGVSATVSGSLIYVSWNSVSNATSYRVYRGTSASGSYSLIGSPTSTNFYDSNPLTGYNYYKVTAVNSAGESSYSTYAYCNYSGGATVPSAPTGVTATVLGNSANSYVSVSWTPVSNATGYQVYRSSSANGSFSLIGSPTSSTPYYYDYNPLSGYNYYKVKAVNSAGESSYSSYASCYYTPPVMSPCPPSVSVSGTSSQTVSWTPVINSGCGTPTSYEVYHRNPCNGNTFELMTTTTSTSYSVSSSIVHPGINYYIVKAINSSGNSQNYASSSSVSLSAPSTFSVQKLSGGYLKFTWSAVSKATGYQIFISDHPSPNSGYTIMTNGWVTGGSTTTTTIYYPGTSGSTMYFKMKAFYDCGDYWELSNLTSTYKSITF